MKLSYRAKSPLDHFMNVMQVSGGTLSGNGLFRYLVCEKGKKIADEFHDVIRDEAWWTRASHEDRPLDSH